jgi:hypothetical protein
MAYYSEKYGLWIQGDSKTFEEEYMNIAYEICTHTMDEMPCNDCIAKAKEHCEKKNVPPQS